MKNKYTLKNIKGTAEQILIASGVTQDENDEWYFVLNSKLGFYKLTEACAKELIQETLNTKLIDIFDSESDDPSGTLEINGRQIAIDYSCASKTAII